MNIDMTMDTMWGSCGKGGITGWLAVRGSYDTVVCSYGTQAGHTYNNKERDISIMVQQVPVGIVSSTVKNVMIGPGSLINYDVLARELNDFARYFEGKRLLIHEHAAVVTDNHSHRELNTDGMTRLGSTAKGVGAAAADRLMRKPGSIVRDAWRDTPLAKYIVDRFEYDAVLRQSQRLLVEGAQGFCLSLYHGAWPYTTSRDVTPWQIAADCGLPFAWAPDIRVIAAMRTYPIRVNNRDGSSGPCYPDQSEISFESIGQQTEFTTVTKLPRRLFTFSDLQAKHGAIHCLDRMGEVALTFADYCLHFSDLVRLIDRVFETTGRRVTMLSFGPDDSDVIEIGNFGFGSTMVYVEDAYMRARAGK